MPSVNEVLSWLHIGDLHLTRETEQNHWDLKRIVDLAKGLPAGSIDFAVLPGDNADDGTPEQFRLVRDAMAPLPMPLHILPGDHDFKPGTLNAFHDELDAEPLPKVISLRGYRCLFLDVVSAGSGGPDFRLGRAQLAWVEGELEQAKAAGQDAVIFMHTYPADLREGADRLGALLAQPHVLCVDIGHTHYNELANDGGTVFMATRSTGQIEEGPPGFSIAAVDGRRVSWRFKPLDAAWPFVLITCPTDRRLATDTIQTTGEASIACVKVLGDASITAVDVRVETVRGRRWRLCPASPRCGRRRFQQAEAACSCAPTMQPDEWMRIGSSRAGRDGRCPNVMPTAATGDRVGPWLEKGIPGAQLGPNRNGRKW